MLLLKWCFYHLFFYWCYLPLRITSIIMQRWGWWKDISHFIAPTTGVHSKCNRRYWIWNRQSNDKKRSYLLFLLLYWSLYNSIFFFLFFFNNFVFLKSMISKQHPRMSAYMICMLWKMMKIHQPHFQYKDSSFFSMVPWITFLPLPHMEHVVGFSCSFQVKF